MLIIIFILIFNTRILFANNYYPVGKSGSNTVYKSKLECELKESFTCFDITGYRNVSYLYVENNTLKINNSIKSTYENNKLEELRKRKDRILRIKSACKTMSGIQKDICEHIGGL